MKHNYLYVSCPICGQQLIKLNESDKKYHEYWCDKCVIDIMINEEINDEEDK